MPHEAYIVLLPLAQKVYSILYKFPSQQGRKETQFMKKIYLPILLTIIALTAFGQRRQQPRWNNQNPQQVSQQLNTNTAALHLTFSSYNTYTITLGAQSLSFYGNQFFFENVPPGLVMVSIRYQTNNQNGGAWQTAYNGAINFEANTRLFATIDALGILRVTQREIMPQNPNPWPQNPNTQPPPAPQVVFATDVQATELVNRLINISFDNKRVQTAKNALKNNYYTAHQVKRILETFSFDTYRLDVAKYAYDVSYDKGNFFVVGDAFDFDSYADDLERYMAKR